MNYSKIKRIAKNSGIKRIVTNINTAGLCSIGAGGKAAALVTVESPGNLIRLLDSLEQEKIRYYMVGDGTNVVFTGKDPDIILIKLGKTLGSIDINSEGLIRAGASASMPLLVKKAAVSGLDLTYMAGIPGTVGGAVSGNSGSSGKWICESIMHLEYIHRTAAGFIIAGCDASDISFGYRSLHIPGMTAIISVVLATGRSDSDELNLKIKQSIEKRRKTQPVGSKTSGCFFKNPGNGIKPAGILIDGCGLKGFSFGGARVSKIHANFIENFKSASPEDIVVLSRIIVDKVREKYGVSLEYEVKLIG